MNGLLDDNSQAQLMLAAGLLGGGNFGQALQRGLLGYGQSMAASEARKTSAEDRLMRRQLQEAQMEETRAQAQQRMAQIEEIKRKQAQAEQLNALKSRFVTQDGQFDFRGFANAAASTGLVDPAAAAKLISEAQDKYHFATSDGNTTIFNTSRPGAPVVGTHQAGPNINKDLLMPNGQGGYIPNQQLIDVKRDLAKAGAAATSVKVENKMGESIAAQVGPMMKESYVAAQGAATALDSARRIMGLIDSNKVRVGPTAPLIQFAGQLGVPGANDEEKLTATSSAIRELARLTLEGRKQMQGQGAITEKESALAQAAMSGDISKMSIPELRALAFAAKRASEWQLQEHSRKVKLMSGNPNTSGIAPFYDVATMPSDPVQTGVRQRPATQNADDLVNFYSGR